MHWLIELELSVVNNLTGASVLIDERAVSEADDQAGLAVHDALTWNLLTGDVKGGDLEFAFPCHILCKGTGCSECEDGCCDGVLHRNGRGRTFSETLGDDAIIRDIVVVVVVRVERVIVSSKQCSECVACSLRMYLQETKNDARRWMMIME